MEHKITYRELKEAVAAMRSIIAEQNEFKPKIGDGVSSGNKKANNEFYTNAKKLAKEEPMSSAKKNEREDKNRTTLEYRYENEPSDKFKKRVHAQAMGYTSELEKSNGIEKNAAFGDEFYKGEKKHTNKIHQDTKQLKKSGLQARELPDDVFDKNDIFESAQKTVRFRTSKFLSENHMKSMIPDEMKQDGLRFNMIDANDNTYLVEWTKSPYNGEESAVIVEHRDVNKMNETFDRMKALCNYRPSTHVANTTVKSRLQEGNEGFQNTLDAVRKLNK